MNNDPFCVTPAYSAVGSITGSAYMLVIHLYVIPHTLIMLYQ